VTSWSKKVLFLFVEGLSSKKTSLKREEKTLALIGKNDQNSGVLRSEGGSPPVALLKGKTLDGLARSLKTTYTPNLKRRRKAPLGLKKYSLGAEHTHPTQRDM